MEESMKFNSQVCTTKIQSKRLLELGLKPETADMCWFNDMQKPFCSPYKCFVEKAQDMKWIISPAWSLHRLLEMLPGEIKQKDSYYSLTFDKDIIQYEDYGVDVLKSFGDNPCFYDNIVDCIKWLISNSYFNKEYLKQ